MKTTTLQIRLIKEARNFLCALLLLGFNINVSFAQDWQWLNPLPQGNSLNDVDFVDASTGYAVGESGTILKTTDGGENWTTLDPGIIVYFTSVDFIDAYTGYAAGDDLWKWGFRILKTTDEEEFPGHYCFLVRMINGKC